VSEFLLRQVEVVTDTEKRALGLPPKGVNFRGVLVTPLEGYNSGIHCLLALVLPY